MIVNIAEAKTNLSKLVDMVYHGEKVVIAKNNLPIVDLVINQPTSERKLGLLAGKFATPDDFINEDVQMNDMFYSGELS
jgi:antitoxin (DNA-binding transcriptional repressor) of toxin-antitoxin stability system